MPVVDQIVRNLKWYFVNNGNNGIIIIIDAIRFLQKYWDAINLRINER